MKIKPINNKVVLRPVEPDKVSQFGIILPTVKNQKISFYQVIKGGKNFKRKTTVICSEYAGYDFKKDGVQYKIVDQDSILARYED